MARYKVTELSEVLRTWYVEAASQEAAEQMIANGDDWYEPDKETGECIEMNVEAL